MASSTSSTLSVQTSIQPSSSSSNYIFQSLPPTSTLHFPSSCNNNLNNKRSLSVTTTTFSEQKWRTRVSFFPSFMKSGKDSKTIKEELLEAIAPLDRGAEATPEDQERIDKRPKLLRSRANYQAINADILRAQNMESWPFFNQVTADLTPLNSRKVAVQFDQFKILGLIPVKAPGRARGELEITYLDEELRVSRGDKGNLFILKMIDPSYRVPV
ncbi:probable plastid-lipid-associated protein 4, chloroplastic isoform X2 [Papaver somniferum]|uniref:probable plastid-lipid-associated protein 4, chloroplastic isoform X2 n=1 Tax=Papaver somniferum TaxID=3469 RepID=UPI000E7014EB|nr:probable plastid-lipid-associated protein 4, chloroplastic isoform X2 [Papaver somniferum]